MQIQLHNTSFKKNFLEQISRISDSAVINLKDSTLECLTNSPDNSIILSTSFKVESDPPASTASINVGDVKKLIRAFDCISSDNITFKVDSNNITYSDNDVQFKYHLLENGIISQPKINIQKLESVNFDCEFTLTDKAFSDLIKASTFSTDSNKIYLTSYDSVLKGNLTDRSRHNVDSFEINMCNNFVGNKIDNLCINFEVFRILSTLRLSNINCKIASSLGVVLFSFENNILKTKYIVSSLTK
jgi:hypothetical protein